MNEGSDQRWLMAWAGMTAASLITLVISIVIVRSLVEDEPVVRRGSVVASDEKPIDAGVASLRAGVYGRVTAGGITSDVVLPAMAFTVNEGQSLSSLLPSGPFEAELAVGFDPGQVRGARIGARLQNGSLIIRRGDEVLLATSAEAEPREVLMSNSRAVPGMLQELRFEYRTSGEPPYAVRAIWQPEGSQVSLPLPASGAPLLSDDVAQGELLVMDRNCVACHQSSDATLQARLAVSPGPILGEVGARVRPEWLRIWIRDPHDVKAGSLMPHLGMDANVVEDVTHYLVSLGGPIPTAGDTINENLVVTGEAMYHGIGCFACHGPLSEESAGRVLRGVYHALGHLREKTTPAHLSAFLRAPLAFRPSGRMPNMQLSALEADSISAYLMSLGEPPPASVFRLDSARARRGEEQFSSLGCVNCHELGPNRTAPARRVNLPPLESLAGATDRGCMTQGGPGVPSYHLSRAQHRQISAFLNSLSERRCHDVPIDSMALSLQRLNCVACHQAYASNGPEPALLKYYQTVGEADLGDEGRLPPDLTDVGSRLNRDWMGRVLEEDARARPWMAVRMPEFGEAVHGLTDDLIAAAGVGPAADYEPEFDQAFAAHGRTLVGDAGLNCIQCHDIAGRASTGTPGPDLALATERLRYDGFNRWLHDPANVRPGTRMPSFFVGGYSGVRSVLDGKAQDQVDSMWHYLSQGELLPLPDGLVDPSGLELQVTDRPLVFRTFMASAGVRSIAVGFPEQVHYAFDADTCRIAAAWAGQFLNVKNAWASRGGSETNPQLVQWTAADGLQLSAASDAGGGAPSFKGYRLDDEGRPTFLYSIASSVGEINAFDHPAPAIGVDGARIVRAIELRGPPRARCVLHPRGAQVTESVPAAQRRDDGSHEITLDSDGSATIVLEVTW